MGKPMSKVGRAVEVFTKALGGLHTWVYKKSGGVMGGHFVFGAPIVLLTTTGRKSGKARTCPLIYLRDGERLILVASKGGHPHHPAWYMNLCSQPLVDVQLGEQQLKMRAVTGTPEQKAKYWQRLCAIYPPYQSYQNRTDRDIPVVILQPI
jgi:deazaflavin-dependent oxidoreductase (nitroreductase family)